MVEGTPYFEICCDCLTYYYLATCKLLKFFFHDKFCILNNFCILKKIGYENFIKNLITNVLLLKQFGFIFYYNYNYSRHYTKAILLLINNKKEYIRQIIFGHCKYYNK